MSLAKSIVETGLSPEVLYQELGKNYELSYNGYWSVNAIDARMPKNLRMDFIGRMIHPLSQENNVSEIPHVDVLVRRLNELY